MWHYWNMTPTMIHGQPFYNITWQPTDPPCYVGCGLRIVTSTQSFNNVINQKGWDLKLVDLIWFIVFNTTFQQYFSYIIATSFSGGRSQSSRREPPTMGKQLVNLRVKCTLFCNLQSRVLTHAVLVIGLYELLSNPTT